MNKTVLITGVTGMVGSHLADYLLKKTKFKIYGLCRWRSPLDNVEHLLSIVNQKNSRLKFLSADLNDYSYGKSGVDFLLESQRLADSIVTNPPYKLATEFIHHAITLGVNKHAWLLRLSFLEGIARHKRLYQNFDLIVLCVYI